ncbi:MAG TPA: SpoIID/LytB domain-containing protein, partial [Labilithrix sp.]
MRLGWLGVVLFAACSAPPSESERVGHSSEALAFSAIEPLTTVYVANAGALDVETQYLPQVVCCENGAAPKTALEAQAVMARTYMYFRNASDGLGTMAKPFQGTQADQAYHCTTKLSQACTDAVVATHDLVAAFDNDKGVLTANASFFVDGPRPACLANKACTCAQPAPTVSMSPTDHEMGCDCFTDSSQGLANPAYVTYNWSHSGADVTASTLGSTSNESNRGCASQNIQACLSYAGWSYLDQLRFFYGQDIALYHSDGTPAESADGGVPPPPPPVTDGGAPPDAAIADA